MEFLKGAKDFARNPLGIIALFISLIYGFASLLLNASAEKLTEAERWPLIIFIVLFPVMVLGAFYKLVTNHHGKLYAPSDYKDDKSFLRTLSQEERDRKLDNEAKEVQEAQEIESTKSEVSANRDQTGPQPVRKSQSQSEIRNELQVVESLVIAKFEAEFNQRATRDVGVGPGGVAFDAFFAVNEQFTFVEVKVVRTINAFSMMLDRVLYSAIMANQYVDSKFKLIFAIVHDMSDVDLQRIQSIWQRRIEGCPATVELRLISRKALGA